MTLSPRFRRLRSVDELKSRLANRRVLASLSGGKDSAAMCLYLRELGVDFEPVFCDTGWEHPLTYEYLRGPLTQHLGQITWLRSEHDMVGWIRKFGMFPTLFRHWCTHRMKVRPFQRYAKSIGSDVVQAVGIRADESSSRAKLPAWQRERRYLETWRPILRWPLSEVWAIHDRHGLPRNPLYGLGLRRVGCWPCTLTSQSGLVRLAELDPGRVAVIRDLEAEISARVGTPRTWCSDSSGKRPLPIDEAIKRARANTTAESDADHECAGGGGCGGCGGCPTKTMGE
jgi:3'-phosphoadenosine 5'-phosphosulfate sulfotransferase (PAPS reductase)/FAD synthetase